MWYRRENGVLVGGPYNATQAFPVELLDEASPEVIAFLAPKPPPLTAKQLKLQAVLADPTIPQKLKDLLALL